MKNVRAVTDGDLYVHVDGKRYQVNSLEDAREKWIAFRDETGGGVSQIGNGVDVVNDVGLLIGRVSYNGLMWDAMGNELLPTNGLARESVNRSSRTMVSVLKPSAEKQSSPKRKSLPIPANVAAIWGAFLYEGLLACYPDLKRGKEILRRWALGCDHLLAEVCAYLPEVWQQIEPRWYEKDFPGVFEYEVIAPLGVSIGDYLLLNHGELPPRELVKEFIADLIGAFFQQVPIGPELPRDGSGSIAN